MDESVRVEACKLCAAEIEWIDAGGREYAFDSGSGELHSCWSLLPEGEPVIRLD